MSGGTWSAYDKIRSGTYINVKAGSRNGFRIGQRGIVAVPLSLSWGEEGKFLSLTSRELDSENFLEKTGLRITDAEAKPFREVFKYCPTGLFYRLNSGGIKASATVGGLLITAKHPGTVGNDISVSVVGSDNKYSVNTYYKTVRKDSQIVESGADLKSNAWVDFEEENELEISAGSPLVGGTDGVVSATEWEAALAAMELEAWHAAAMPGLPVSLQPTALDYIKKLRDTNGRKRQLVIKNFQADYEGIISPKQGYISEGVDIDGDTFLITVASMTAGQGVGTGTSNTYRELTDATGIINQLDDAHIKQGILQGFFLLSQADDRAILVETDINTLTTYTENKSREFSKNKILRTLDSLHDDLVLVGRKSIIGKIDVDATGEITAKAIFKKVFDAYEEAHAITNFQDDDFTISILDFESFKVGVWVQPVDSTEKLYIEVFVTRSEVN